MKRVRLFIRVVRSFAGFPDVEDYTPLVEAFARGGAHPT
jgi:hypothetical protein